jgi:hypothetical protein
MGNTWITDIRHYLNEDGEVVPESGPARHLAEDMCAIVAVFCITLYSTYGCGKDRQYS